MKTRLICSKCKRPVVIGKVSVRHADTLSLICHDGDVIPAAADSSMEVHLL